MELVALDRYHKEGSGSLSDTDKTLVTVWTFEANVANKGFVDCFKSSDGELAQYAPDAMIQRGTLVAPHAAARANGE